MPRRIEITCEACGAKNRFGWRECLTCLEPLPQELPDTPPQDGLPVRTQLIAAGAVMAVLLLLAFAGGGRKTGSTSATPPSGGATAAKLAAPAFVVRGDGASRTHSPKTGTFEGNEQFINGNF